MKPLKSFEATSLQREKGFTYRAASNIGRDAISYRESRNFFINIYNSNAFKTRFFSFLLLAMTMIIIIVGMVT